MPDHYLLPKRLAEALPGLSGFMARVDALLLKSSFRFLAWLSPDRATRVAAAVFGFFGPLGSKSLKIRNNLRQVFPDADDAEIKRLTKTTFRHAGIAAAELAQGGKVFSELHDRVEMRIDDPRIERPQAGSPAVMVTSHVGAWQYAGMLGPLMGFKLNILYAPEFNPFVRDLFYSMREALGFQWISRDNAMRPMMKELSAGNRIGLATDTRYDQGKMLPFFGRPAATNTTPARLALRYGCPLIAARCDRLPEYRYRIVLTRLITPDPDCQNTEDQILNMTEKLNQEFERWIKDDPGYWLCMKRRWPKD